jgi:hypothetical protein
MNTVPTHGVKWGKMTSSSVYGVTGKDDVFLVKWAVKIIAN